MTDTRSPGGYEAVRNPQLDAVIEACNRELDAPLDRPRAEREAWAEGYTQACRDVLAALREAS